MCTARQRMVPVGRLECVSCMLEHEMPYQMTKERSITTRTTKSSLYKNHAHLKALTGGAMHTLQNFVCFDTEAGDGEFLWQGKHELGTTVPTGDTLSALCQVSEERGSPSCLSTGDMCGMVPATKYHGIIRGWQSPP
jgi:hypothetical protein